MFTDVCMGTSDIAPGFRPQYSPDFYAASVRHPDGSKRASVWRGVVAPLAPHG